MKPLFWHQKLFSIGLFYNKKGIFEEILKFRECFKKILERYLGKFLWGCKGQGSNCFLWWETFCSYLLGNRNSDSVGLSKTSRETRVGVSCQPEVLSIFWIHLFLLFSACKLWRRTQWVQRPQCIPSGADWGN